LHSEHPMHPLSHLEIGFIVHYQEISRSKGKKPEVVSFLGEGCFEGANT